MLRFLLRLSKQGNIQQGKRYTKETKRLRKYSIIIFYSNFPFMSMLYTQDYSLL